MLFFWRIWYKKIIATIPVRRDSCRDYVRTVQFSLRVHTTNPWHRLRDLRRCHCRRCTQPLRQKRTRDPHWGSRPCLWSWLREFLTRQRPLREERCWLRPPHHHGVGTRRRRSQCRLSSTHAAMMAETDMSSSQELVSVSGGHDRMHVWCVGGISAKSGVGFDRQRGRSQQRRCRSKPPLASDPDAWFSSYRQLLKADSASFKLLSSNERFLKLLKHHVHLACYYAYIPVFTRCLCGCAAVGFVPFSHDTGQL